MATTINPFADIDERLKSIEDTLLQLVNKPEPAQPIPEKYFTTDQVCDMLHVSRVTLWNWEKSKILKPIRIGRLKRYERTEIEDFVSSKEREH